MLSIRQGVVSALVLAGSAGHLQAQDIEPRAYSNAPVGVNFLVAGYVYSQGGLALDPAVPLTNADLEVHHALLAYARVFELAGQSAKFDLIVPYASLSGTADFAGAPVAREVSGFGDPRLRLSMNFYGAPALSIKDYSGYRQDLIVGGSLQVSVPLGQYDPDKLVNLGSHRWYIKPELGVSKSLGPWTLELAAGAFFFTANDDFFGGQRREQDPIYSLQGHLVYGFPSGVWAAVTGTYVTGGRTTVDGVEGDDLQRNSRLGATLALPLDRNHSIKLYASTGVSIRTGTDFDSLGVAWQYRWGGGL